MPRYVVQRTFPEGLHIPVDNSGAETCAGVIERNAEEGVTYGGALSAPVGSISQPSAVASSSGGFEWDDTAIGAAGATLLLGAGGLTASGRARRRRTALS